MRLATSTHRASPLTVNTLGPLPRLRKPTVHPVAARIRVKSAAVKVLVSCKGPTSSCDTVTTCEAACSIWLAIATWSTQKLQDFKFEKIHHLWNCMGLGVSQVPCVFTCVVVSCNSDDQAALCACGLVVILNIAMLVRHSFVCNCWHRTTNATAHTSQTWRPLRMQPSGHASQKRPKEPPQQ